MTQQERAALDIVLSVVESAIRATAIRIDAAEQAGKKSRLKHIRAAREHNRDALSRVVWVRKKVMTKEAA